MIHDNCIKNKKCLPTLPCTEKCCPWYVNCTDLCNCFWLVADFMAETGFDGFSDEDIAAMLEIPLDEVEEIVNDATKHIRILLRKHLVNIDD